MKFLKNLFTTMMVLASWDASATSFAVDDLQGDFSIMILGSGHTIARPDQGGRAGQSYVVFVDGEAKILIDAGGGSYQRLAQSGVDLKELELVLISHLNVDNVGDLTPIVQSIWFEHIPPLDPSPRFNPINLFGPSANGRVGSNGVVSYDGLTDYLNGRWDEVTGVERQIHRTMEAEGAGDFNWTSTEIPSDVNLPQRVIYDEEGLVITAIAVDHGEIPAVSYSIEYKGKKIVYTGDLRGTTDNAAILGANADIFITNGSIPFNIDHPYHIAPVRIGELAQQAHVENLIISHISVFAEGRFESMRESIRQGGFTKNIGFAEDLQVFNLRPQG